MFVVVVSFARFVATSYAYAYVYFNVDDGVLNVIVLIFDCISIINVLNDFLFLIVVSVNVFVVVAFSSRFRFANVAAYRVVARDLNVFFLNCCLCVYVVIMCVVCVFSVLLFLCVVVSVSVLSVILNVCVDFMMWLLKCVFVMVLYVVVVL